MKSKKGLRMSKNAFSIFIFIFIIFVLLKVGLYGVVIAAVIIFLFVKYCRTALKFTSKIRLKIIDKNLVYKIIVMTAWGLANAAFMILVLLGSSFFIILINLEYINFLNS